jgi:hypothetical protein
MNKDTRIPPWAKWLTGAVLLTVALIAGGVSLMLNVSHGLEAGPAAGITFGLADIGKITIPIVAGIIGWSMQMRTTATVCVLVSLWCAVNYYCDHHGRDLLAKQHGQTVYADTKKQIAELETLVTRYDEQAATEAKSGKGPNWRLLTAKASDARQRLLDARAARAETKPVEVSGLATMIAMASGAQPNGIARGIGAVKAAMFLVLLEALVWLSVPAMTLLSQAARREAVAKAAAPVAKPVQTPAKRAAAGTRQYYLQRLETEYPALAKQVHDGAMSCHKACVEAGIRKAPTKKWTTIDAYVGPVKIDA